MSCPNWSELLEQREQAKQELPSDWSEAIGHLRGCRGCRSEALRLDPTLLFSTQPTLEVTDAEVSDIVASVRTLRRSRQTEEDVGEPRRRWGRFAAAAAAIFLLVLLPNLTPRQAAPPLTDSPRLASEFVAAPGSIVGDLSAPVIEPLDLPLARIYQLGEEDLSVVMVVDESLDV